MMVKLLQSVKTKIIKGITLPLVFFLCFIFAYTHYKLKIAPLISPKLQQDAKKFISTIFVLCLTFIVQRLITAVLGWYNEKVAIKTISKLDDKMIPLVRRTSTVVIWVVALLVILPFYGVNISALVATLGVGSLAIALAAQDTIANIIAGYLLMIDTPFRIGDRIKLPSGEIVQVLDIGIRRSQFLSEDKAIIIVPNVDLSKSKIVNYTFGEERRGSK